MKPRLLALLGVFLAAASVQAHADCTPAGTNLDDTISCTLDLTTPFDTGAGNDVLEVLTGATLSADVSTSSGNDYFDLNGGTGNANIFLGSGNDTFIYNTDTSTLNGNVDAGTGIDAIVLKGAGSIPFDALHFESFNALNVDTGYNNVATLLGDLGSISNINLIDGAGINVSAGSSITASVGVSGTDPHGSQVFINGGSLTGDIDFTGLLNGNGTQAVSITNGGVLVGNASFGDGADVYELSGGSTHTGTLDLGDGLNVATLESGSALTGDVLAGVDNDILAINNATATGNVNLSDGNNIVQMSNNAQITGAVTVGAGNDSVNVNSGSNIGGNLALGEGDNTLGMLGGGSISGSVSAGSGNDTLNLSGGSTLASLVSLGDGNNTVNLSEGNLLGDLLLGSGNDVLTLQDSSVSTVFMFGGADTLNIDNDSSFTAIYGGNGADVDVVNATESGQLWAEGIDQFEQLSIAHGAETVLAGPSMVFPSVTLLNNSQFGLAENSTLTGNIEAGDTNTLGMAASISGTLVGNIDFTTSGNNGAGLQTVQLNAGSTLVGDIKTGDGDDILLIYPRITQNGLIDLGEEAGDNDIMRIIGDAAYATDLASTNDASRTSAEQAMRYTINGPTTLGVDTLRIENYAHVTMHSQNTIEEEVYVYENAELNAAGAQITTKSVTNAGVLDLTNDGLGVANDLRLSGNFNQTPTGKTVFGLGTVGGQSDQIVASGTATLDGAFELQDPSVTIYQVDDRFDLIAADAGVVGKFADAEYPEGYIWTQHYDPNLFWVEITGYNALHALPQDCSEISNFNLGQACEGLDRTNPTGGAATLSSAVSGLTGDALTQALLELSPQSYAGNQYAAFGAMDNFTTTLKQRMGNVREVPLARDYRGLNVWVRGNGSHQEIDQKADEIGYAITHAGTTLGADAAVGDTLNVGMAGHLSQGDIDYVGRSGGQTDLDTRQLAAYATYQNNGFYVDGIASVADLDYEARRPVQFQGFNETASANYKGDGASAQLEVGKELALGSNTFLEPYALANYTNINNKSFTETGAGAANLAIDGKPVDRIAGRVGVRARKEVNLGFATLSPELHVAYQREFSDDYTISAVNAQYAEDPVLSSHQGRFSSDANRAIVGAGLEGSIGKGMTAFANYDATLAEGDVGHALNIGARWQNTVE